MILTNIFLSLMLFLQKKNFFEIHKEKDLNLYIRARKKLFGILPKSVSFHLNLHLLML